MQIVILLLIALIAPLPLMVVEKVMPFPFIIEEIFGLILVFLFLREEKKLKKNLIWFVVLSGILFSVSESIFYLLNILTSGTPLIFFERLIFTTILHTLNLLILFVFGRKNIYWLIAGFIIVVIVHYIYNAWIVSLIV